MHFFDFSGLAPAGWVEAIAQNLIASVIFAVVTFLIARAIYRAKLTDKDVEIKSALAGAQEALRLKAAAQAEAERLRPGSLETALAGYEREEKDGNYERAAEVLKEYFERERANLARLAGTLGDWYGGFLGDENAAGMLPRAKSFYNFALFADPGNERWQRAASQLDMTASIAKLDAGTLPDEADGFDDHFAYAMGSSLQDAAALIAALVERSRAMEEEGNYYASYLLARRAYRVADRQFGEQHAATLAVRHRLASSLRFLGFYKEALSNAQAVLAIRERTSGMQHLDTANSCNLVGMIFHDQGRYDDAEPLFRRALAISEKALGAEHPDTATSLGNLAGLYDAQGRYGDAEPLFRRALAISEKALGAEHPDTATSLNNLAALYELQGRYGDAEPLFRRALAIREKALGAEHPSTATSLNNLAGLPGPVRRCGATLPARAGHRGEGAWRGASLHRHEPQQSRRAPYRPGPVRRCGAALPARAGDPREGAWRGASQYRHEPQQSRRAL